MKKPIMAAIIAAFSLSTPALSETLIPFFERNIGNFHIEGYRGSKNFCAIKSLGDDASYLSVFSRRKYRGVSLMIHHEEWGIYNGGRAEITLSSEEGEHLDGSADFERHDSHTIIFRNMPMEFFEDIFRSYSINVAIPGENVSFDMEVQGMVEVLPALVDCIKMLRR